VENIGFVFALIMLAGGWLLEIAGARKVEKWLLAHDVEHRKGNGIITRVRNSIAYFRETKKKKEPPVWALAYIGGLLTSFGGIFLLLYLKATNKI
jgi:hypothetical protein